MKMNKNNFSKIARTTVVCVCLVGLSTLTFNCGGQKFQSAGVSESSSLGGVTPGVYDKPVSPYALMTGEQQFQSMLNVTGQAMPTPAQVTEYSLRQGALADNDNLAVVSAPLMMGSTSLAGEVCNGLLVKEKALAAAARTFFAPVDFTKTIAANSAQAFSTSAESLAQALYGRSLKVEEQSILSAFYAEFTGQLTAAEAAQTAQTTALYLSLCSGMLATFDSMTY